MLMQTSMHEDMLSCSMVEMNQFKDINADLEKKFQYRIDTLQTQIQSHEDKEKDLFAQINDLESLNRDNLRLMEEMESEMNELNSIKLKWETFKK